MAHPLRFAAPALLALSAAFALPSAASAACISTPSTASVADASNDGQSGIAPEATALGVSVDGTCNATFSYSIIGQTSMLDDDFLSWFVNTDGNVATGSNRGFAGADIAIGRLGTGNAYVSRWNPATASFGSTTVVGSSGTFGATVDLSTLVPLTPVGMTVAGGTSWTGPTGTTYYDWVPNPGAAPLPFTVSLGLAPDPTPIPTPAPAPVAPPVTAPAPTPVPVPATTSATSVSDDDSDACEVPTVRRLTLTKAKARIRHAVCKIGDIHKKSSKMIPAGKVIQADQAPGDFVDLGTELDLTVSTGKPKAHRLEATAPTARATQVTDLLNAAAAGAR